MKKLLPVLAALCIFLAACTNRRAQSYVDRLQSGEQVSAADYSEMVEFYCTSLDGMIDELQPLHREQADAINAGDSLRAAKNAEKLNKKTARVAEKYSAVTALGNELFLHLESLPDSTRLRLITHLADISRRYSDY